MADRFDDETGQSCSTSNAASTFTAGAATISRNSTQNEMRWKRRLASWCCQAPYGGNGEALGWALDGMGRSVSFMGAAVFGGTALLHLAKEEAGCETEPPEGETEVPDCDGRVYGIRPSSLLTTLSTVVALVSAALLPLVGSIIDHTPHRLLVGRVSAIVVVVLLFPFIFINENTWFAMGILVLFVAFAGWIHTCISFAYLPEVTDDEDEMMRFTASFTIVQYISTVGYILAMVGILYVLGLTDDSIASNRIAQIVSFTFTSCVFCFAWTNLFRERPAFQKVPEGSTVLTAGFKNVYLTSKRIYKDYSALKWFYVAVAFSDAGAQSLASVALTFVTDQLQFTTTENGMAVIILLVGTVPGCMLSKQVTRRFSPVHSAAACLLLLAGVTAVAASLLTGPDQKPLAFVCAAAWGVGTGWKYSSERFIVCQIIPKGQDAELMGLYLFFGQVLVWLPALIFTAMNEAGVSMRIGIGIIGIFFLLGMAGYFMVGDYKEAVRVANAGVESRISTSVGAETGSEDDQSNECLPAINETRITEDE
mmetsp:Transcript_62987/g.186036  ORF Transcript_62987/g.186036 Transcript_62987/m.186036 type:complete len:537 (-) Transcript_62987:375-1985(-)|eukprot:CAMPEP_0113586878 /NCGR_PEP_ID=MMETSP0015_2-20120614/34558_1 /TAXON_ID=2838 /ORGANISM="Odontella" /LENGTH=536 /DNA_ID=CAMNT_0000492397 /DNA_START=66 /DNA_END=1676 /DNA_ORIENTATION=+ /assembly_acc=CAM_ASM_000160